jgi:glycosyltransferase involved in cell wall biosynthesis
MEAAVRLLGRTGAMARIGWGVDVTRFRPGLDVNGLRERWQIPADAVVIFSPRIARPFYNLDWIIQAFAAVRKRVPKAWLVLAEPFADRAYVARLRGLADELGLRDRVRFVGALPYGDMPLWLNLAALSVMVPRSDGMPNSLWEAMACGAVPVLNRLPQYAELITDGENGWFAGPTPNELAETLVSALADPSERDRMARRNREIVLARGHQDREMDAMERWYETLAEGGTAPAPVEANQGKDAQLPCAGSPGSLS